ncbi:zinc finger BED domain-containing protein 4-like [Coregonus clupeaformis]|uniref:zinc finger BED domain-containing protein 4-like n=1 Tax=Coregonus clupeaformis TaxID=59861 RepID=UPI001E1C4E65|nr:zinc finger BED domain-containing protein 4-like [Coregonus clupeaformis]XP_041726946.2 zinc finger BED domain-containing protein 4-like [Coregonus clupeaformis]
MSDTRKRSSIWLQFKDIGNKKAECLHCKTKVTIRAGSTTNLHRHTRTVHPTVQLEERGQASSPSTDPGVSHTRTTAAVTSTAIPMRASITSPTATQSKISQFLPKLMTPAKQHSIDDELAKMVASDFQPFSIVEDKGMKNFVKALNPTYTLPSRKTLSQTMIPKLYDTERALWQERVTKAPSVCLTTDCWTSRTTCSFMSVTCHFIEDYKMTSCLLDCFEFTDRHTAENLAVELLRVAKEWQVEDKVVCCVSDNAANITKAIKVLKWTHHPCLAHTLNLVVRDALKVIKTTVDKVKAVVEFFHKSTVAAQKLKSTQRQMGIPELRPKQECATRWNSTFDMLKRMLEIKDAIISTLALINASIEPLSQEEWELVKEVCAVLQPFQEVTVEISADSYVTASKMLLLCKGLQLVTAENQWTVTVQKVKELVAALCSAMDRKFLRMEYNTVLSETTLLDPRFKKLAFSDRRAVDEALQRISAAAAAKCTPSSQPAPPLQGQVEEEQQTSAVWRLLMTELQEMLQGEIRQLML